ncbi:MAG: hypothetical protein L3K06_08685, partial [Thermoplasmata archaeon]|nr:hypothetical protein [Thermoplasmata archaeon]
DHLTPSPSQYARVVQSYVAAIHRIDPVAPVLGLPGIGTGSFQETAWINATVALNGPNISGIAIHAYPAGAGPATPPTVEQFLQNASEPRALGSRLAVDRAAIAAALPSRPQLPIYVTELGTGLAAGTFAPFLYTFPSVPFVASEVVAALLYGAESIELAQVQTPHGGSWMDGNGTAHPLLALYTQLLPQLGTIAVPVDLTPSVPGVSALVTTAGPTGSVELLVVNTNSSVAAQLDLSASGLNLSAPTARWTWDGSTGSPVSIDLAASPASWTLAPTSVLLLKVSAPLVPPPTVAPSATHVLPPSVAVPGAVLSRRFR